MRHERFSLLPGSACTSPHPHGARAAFVLVQRWYVARNHESGSSVSAPPGASVARPARIAEPTPVSASALRRKLSAPQLGGYAPSWTLGRYSRTPVQPVLSSETTMNTCKKQNIFVRLFSRARLPTLASSGPVGVCLAARGALQTKRNGPIFCVQSCALVQPLTRSPACRITDCGPQHSSARAIPASRR